MKEWRTVGNVLRRYNINNNEERNEMSKKHATIHDVAQRAGVSIATVSRALSGGSIAAETQERVEAAVRELGYRQSGLRSVMRTGGKKCIGLVISSQESPYYASMCEGITAEAARNGYQVLTLNYPDGTSIATITADLLELNPAGALLAGYMVENNSEQDKIVACLKRIQQAMPLVAIGPPIPGIECARLTADPSQCVRKAINHLVTLGHRRIAFVGGDGQARFSTIRENAYYEEIRRFGCREDPAYVALTGTNAHAGELGIDIMLGNLKREDYPTAVFTINDLVALGAMRQLNRMGMKIPEDIAIVGCDNAFFTPYLTPSLTTVDLRPYEHGCSAIAELIMSINAGHPITFSQSFESNLIVRESCGAALGMRVFP